MKRVGSVIRPSNSGLGNLAWEFFRHGIIHKCLLQPAEAHNHFPERFGDNVRPVGVNTLTMQDMEWLMEDIDVLFFFETPYNENFIELAKARGIKTILMPMHEGEAGWRNQKPDLWVCPSDAEYNLNLPGEKVRINLPVNMDVLPSKLRKKAKVFVHNAGHGGMMFRNGTPELIESLQYSKEPFKLIIRSQSIPYEIDDPRVEYEYVNYEHYWDLWDEGDVLIIPDKFSGLSMPMQEAYASGMMVMTTDREPLNQWLPEDPLMKPLGVSQHYGYMISIPDPEEIARKMDDWFDRDISKFSVGGLKWGKDNSWEKLKPKYQKLINGV